MIKNEKTQKKYDIEKHHARLDKIIAHYNGILNIIDEEIPAPAELEKLYKILALPTRAEDTVIDPSIIPDTFEYSKDVRDKYVLARLVFDTDAKL